MALTITAAYVCPHCQDRLVRRQQDDGVLWLCPTCSGQARGIGLLRRQLDEPFIARLWKAARSAGPTGRRCPACAQSMALVAVGDQNGDAIETCRRCFLVWLDDGRQPLGNGVATDSTSVSARSNES